MQNISFLNRKSLCPNINFLNFTINENASVLLFIEPHWILTAHQTLFSVAEQSERCILDTHSIREQIVIHENFVTGHYAYFPAVYVEVHFSVSQVGS